MNRQLLAILFLLGCTAVAAAQESNFVPACTGANDTPKFTAIIAAIGANYGTIRLPQGNGIICAINNLTIPANVALDNTQGSGIKVNTGQTLLAVGPIINPIEKQIFFNALAGQGRVSLSTSTVFPQWWGAHPESDIAEPFNAALAALPGAGGIVDLRGFVGLIKASSTITINKANVQIAFGVGSFDLYGSPGMDVTANNVHLVGVGERATNLRNLHSGATVRFAAGVERSSISDLSIILASRSPTAQGFVVKGVDSGLSPATSDCYASNIEINGTAVSGQIGLYLDGTGAGGSVITFNRFYNFKIIGIDRPVILEGHTEANMLFGFNIEQYGSGKLGIGAVVNGHANQLNSFWFGRGTSTAAELQGFSVAGDNNILQGIIDAADGDPYVAYLFDLIGKRNIHSGGLLGKTTHYVKRWGNNPSLGPYARVVPSASLPPASVDNEGLVLIEDGGLNNRNLIIYSGGRRFRLGTAVPF